MKHNGKVWQTRVVKASPMWKDSASPEEVVAEGLSVLMDAFMTEEARASVAMSEDFTHTTEEDTEADRKSGNTAPTIDNSSAKRQS